MRPGNCIHRENDRQRRVLVVTVQSRGDECFSRPLAIVGAPAAARRLWVRRRRPSFVGSPAASRRSRADGNPSPAPPLWIPAVTGMTIVGSPAAARSSRGDGNRSPALAVDSRRRGNDDCGCRRLPSFVGAPAAAARRSRGDGNPSPAPPLWIPAVAGMTIVGSPAVSRRLWVRLPPPPVVPVETGTHRRPPAVDFPAVAGMTIVGSPAASRRLWVRLPPPTVVPVETGTPSPALAVDSRRRGSDDCGMRPPPTVVCGCAAASRRSRGDGNPSPALAVDSRRRGSDDCGCARRPLLFVGAPPPPVVPVETGTHRRPSPWIPAVAGVTIVDAPAAHCCLWDRPPPPVDCGCAAASRRSRGDGNPSPAPRRDGRVCLRLGVESSRHSGPRAGIQGWGSQARWRPPLPRRNPRLEFCQSLRMRAPPASQGSSDTKTEQLLLVLHELGCAARAWQTPQLRPLPLVRVVEQRVALRHDKAPAPGRSHGERGYNDDLQRRRLL